MKYIAFVIKGLEELGANELSKLHNLKILSIKQKFIEFEFNDDVNNLKGLKTIDDISIYINEFFSEDLIKENYSQILNFEYLENSIIPTIKSLRGFNNQFSITVSNYKNKEIDTKKIKLQFSELLSKKLELISTPLDHSNLDIRINIEGEKGFISLKLFNQSLFKRKYNHKSTFGSLRSTIAASMIYKLKEDRAHLRMVDNLCGSGTFLCEGYSMGLTIYGGDINELSVELSNENLLQLETEAEVMIQDAKHTKWQEHYFDIAVSNLPWNKQVEEKHIMQLYEPLIKEYARILKDNGSLGLIGMKPDIIKKHVKENFPNHKIDEYRIGYLGQSPTIIFATRK